MVSAIRQLKQDVISACRILSQQKLVEGFGHVSARIPHSDFFLLTPRIALALVTENDLLTINLAGEILQAKSSKVRGQLLLRPGFIRRS